MNLKKFISGISALTIAASAFAGMAVTASAGAYSSPYTLGSDEYIDSILIGDAVYGDETDTSKITAVASETFEAYSETNTYDKYNKFSTDIALRNNTKATEVDATYNRFGTGYGIAMALKTTDTYTYPLDNSITSGKVVFRGDITYPQRNSSVAILGTDSTGNTIEVCKIPAVNNSGNSHAAIFVNGTDINESANNLKTRDNGETIDYIVIDIATGLVSVKISGVTHWSSGESPASYTKSATITGLKSVTGLRFGPPGSNSGYATTLDNVQMYTVASRAATYDYSVNYYVGEAATSENIVKTTEGSVVSGTEITAEAQLTGNDGERYLITASEAPTMTVSDNESANVLNVQVRAAGKYTATVNKVVGGASSVYETKSFVEPDTVSIAYPKYIYNESDSKYYVTSETVFNHTFSSTDTLDITYGSSDIDYYIETSDMATGDGGYAASENNSAASMNNASRLSGRVDTNNVSHYGYSYTNNWSAPQSGKYQVVVHGRNSNSNYTGSYNINSRTSDGTEETLDTVTWEKTDVYYTTKTAVITLSADDMLELKNPVTSNSNVYLDYVTIKSLGAYSFTFTDTDTVVYGNAGDTVYLPSPADTSYTGWMIDGTYYAGGTSYTFTDHDVDATVANEPTPEPSVAISGVHSQPITYKNATYTAAKLLVNVVGSVSGINVTYNATGKTMKATDMKAITNGTIVLGAIVEDGVTVNESTFSVDVAPAE